MKTGLLLFLLMLFASACASNEQFAPITFVPIQESPSPTAKISPSPEITSSPESGVKGQALIGPTCPVMRVENPCPDRPYQTSLIVLSLDGQEVTRFETDAEGKFQIPLSPGEYILHADQPRGRPVIPFAADILFTVLPGEFAIVNITFDSGIR
jgi:hypothetical protein